MTSERQHKPSRLEESVCAASMEAYGLGDEDANPGSKFAAKANQLKIRILDRLSPQVTLRWLIWAGLLVGFALRIWFVKGFYIVAYALGIFNLNLLLGFLSPQVRCLTAHPSPNLHPLAPPLGIQPIAPCQPCRGQRTWSCHGIASTAEVPVDATPQIDPELEGPVLPSKNEEFRPFVRRLPEFKFWCAS